MSSYLELLKGWAERTPHAPAILAPQRTPLRYAELWEQIERAPRVLNTMGLGRGDRIAVALPSRIPHTLDSVSSGLQRQAAALQLTHADRCLNALPMFHMQGLGSALGAPLISGGSVVCSSGFDPEQFLSWLEEFSPTWFPA